MKKIATLTTHGADNYGAVLQAYALQKFIGELGYDCQVINYIPAYTTKEYSLIRKPKTIKEFAFSCFQLLNYTQRKMRKNGFSAFRDDYLSLSGQTIVDHSELIQTVNKYDMVVCGSDQIWNPKMHGFDEAYFLSFDDVSTKLVSYAASFGQDRIDERIKPEIQRRLKKFSSFACREHSAVQLIQELTGNASHFVMDPVFLLPGEKWREIANSPSYQGRYDLLYFLSNPGLSPYAAKRYAAEKGNKVISIGFSPRDYKYWIKCDYSLGPLEFLGVIEHSDVILTNSFHCTAFAILLQKDFYVRLQRGKESRNGRIVSLLSELGLEDRIYYDEEAKELDFSRKIDYVSVRSKLQALVCESKKYLIDVLEERL